MRILAVCQYYWPEPFNVSEICEELVARGHEVTVVTGRPNYPEGALYPGYEGDEHLDEVHNGVRVLRTKIAPRKTGAVNRVRNYYSFAQKGKKKIAELPGDFDVVVVFQLSPVMMAQPALAYARKHGTPVLHYVIDLWPESLLAGGIGRESVIYKLFKRESRKIYYQADVLAVTSPAFEDYLAELLGKEIETVYLPQFAEDAFGDTVSSASSSSVDASLFPHDKLNLMFAGNIGAAQSVTTLIEAAAILREEPFIVHIVGSGTELENCKAKAVELGLTNVVFHGRHPIDEMPAYYSKADVMVATFADDPVLGYTLPRKIQSYMAAGKPVIGTVTGEALRVLEEAGCGFCCKAEDANALAECCRRMAQTSPEERAEYGARAKRYCLEHYSRESFFETLTNTLEKLKGTKHGK